MTIENQVAGSDAIALPEHGFEHQLSVRTGDPSAEIEVLNERFQRVAWAGGSIDRRLPAGIYKVRIGRGSSANGFEERLVVLDRAVTLSIAPPAMHSPAPLAGTRANEMHVAVFSRLDEETHVNVGAGSKIAVLARYDNPAQDGTPLLPPFRGVQLLRGDGQLLVDLGQAAPKPAVPDGAGPISACGISVEPGYYILRHRLADGRDLRQSIIANEGWQITVNIRRSRSSVSPDRPDFVGAGYTALLMHRLHDGKAAKPSRPSNTCT